MMKRFNLCVPEDDRDWLNEVAKKHVRPIAELIRRAIEDLRFRESQPLGSASERIDFSSSECVPSYTENTLKCRSGHFESLEKSIFGKMISTWHLPDTAFFVTKAYVPEYMKK